VQSFGDRVEVFAVSVPLSPSLGRIQPLSGIKLVICCSQQVILVLLIYCREDWATLVPIHIGSLSDDLSRLEFLMLITWSAATVILRVRLGSLMLDPKDLNSNVSIYQISRNESQSHNCRTCGKSFAITSKKIYTVIPNNQLIL